MYALEFEPHKKVRRGTGVYMSIHEASEAISNTARKQKIDF